MTKDFKDNKAITSQQLLVPNSSIHLIDFVKNSFFLPVDVLTSKLFRIEAIVVFEGKEIAEFISSKTERSNWTAKCEGASVQMVAAARHVGVSCRKILATQERVLIAKIWYGAGK